MRNFLIKWLINIAALIVVINVIAGVKADNWQTIVLAAFVLGLLNAFLRPFIVLLTLPFSVFSLGLFTLMINGFMFYLASKFVNGFTVINFWSAFWAALLFSAISFILNLFFAPKINFRVSGHGNGRVKGFKDDDVIDVEGKVEK